MPGLDRVVVVGAGLAGLRCVEGLRSQGYAGGITLVGAEAEAPYDRPPLSKSVLELGLEVPYLRAAEEYAALDVDLRLASQVSSIDTERTVVHLADGTEIGYDQAVIATGAEARRLPLVESAHLHTLRTAQDAARLRESMTAAGELVVIGAGFLGCEVAATARSLDIAVTLIETQSTPLARVLGEVVGAHVADLHRDHGVDLRAGLAITGFAADADATTFVFEDGSRVSGAAVLVAIGASPTTDWLTGSSVKVDDGILCDEFGRTSADGVWAIGDASSWFDPATGTHRRFEHWTNASEQAALVAASIAGETLRPNVGVPYFWSDQYDVKIQSLGDPRPEGLVEVLQVGEHARTVAVYGQDGRTTAVVGFGVPRAVMRLRSAIAAGAPVDEVLDALRR